MVAVTLRSRRDVLRLAGGLAVGALCVPRRAIAVSRANVRALTLYAINTGERASVEYFTGGDYQPEALARLNRLLRDYRTDQVHPIDPRLLDVLFALRQAVGSTQPYHVVCGYRSPETNAARARQSRGVAQHSYHVAGQAVDVFLPECGLRELRSAALSLWAGGVGYYPSNGFVHLDTGPVRTW